jgi:N-methylhydantoinase A
MGMLISIDNGGTLTDACVIDGARVFHAKTLTTPHNLTQCFVEALREVSKRIYGESKLDTLLEQVDYIRYSTTQGTNAVVQRKGPRLGLILRAGTTVDELTRNDAERELLQAMVGDRIEYLDLEKSDDEIESALIASVNELMSRGANRLVVSLGGDTLTEDESRIKRLTLLRYPRHLLGAVPILYSHNLSDDRDNARRTWSSLLNAFLHPAMERFLYSAEGVMRERRARNPLLIFCNDGTSSRVAKTIALKTWGSGPRGGMEGAKALATHYGRQNLVTMDIGGTTTDIGVVQQSIVREARWGKLEEISISFPLSEIESLGAGGSSIFRVTDGVIRVGPESVGGAPGPACFGYGGREATITDAYLLLGVLDAESYFGGTLRLDADRATAAITEKVAIPLATTLDAALTQMEEAYIGKIATAISQLAVQVSNATLLAFGGAGPISACKVAERLGIREIIVPRMAAVFSAFGIGFSDIAHTYDAALPHADESAVESAVGQLTQRARRDMFAEGFELCECKVESALGFTRNGESGSLPLPSGGELRDSIGQAQDIRVRLRATKEIPHFVLAALGAAPTTPAISTRVRRVRVPSGASSKSLSTTDIPLFRHEELQSGQWSTGPAVVEEQYFTCFVPLGWKFLVNENYDLVLNRTTNGT